MGKRVDWEEGRGGGKGGKRRVEWGDGEKGGLGRGGVEGKMEWEGRERGEWEGRMVNVTLLQRRDSIKEDIQAPR